MIRIDMSEYQEKHTVARGWWARRRATSATKKAARLTEAVRRRPYCVILFDEIEKAHHDVFNVLLQILDDGRLHRRPGTHGRFQEHHRHHDVAMWAAAHPGVSRRLRRRGYERDEGGRAGGTAPASSGRSS